jgi:hypothetical protein
MLYFTEDSASLMRELGVDKIVPKGLHIMGVYGGEKKKGEEKYAGLVPLEYGIEGDMFKFKLYNTKDTLVVPIDYLTRHGVKVYRMVYAGEMNPFRITRHLNIILSVQGEAMLKKFLEETLELNARNISAETLNKMRKLIGELRQPPSVKQLSMEKYYVAYRCVRAFTASVYVPVENSIAESHVSYVETRSEDVAYYYAAVLNYLAYIVLRSGRTFNRDQFARPLLAIYIAGLSWSSMDVESRNRIVELSKRLHEKAPNKEYSNQRIALQEIARLPSSKSWLKYWTLRSTRQSSMTRFPLCQVLG